MPKRHYPRHRPSAIKEVQAYLLSRWKLGAVILASIAAVFASIAQIRSNWDSVEPGFIATRFFVRSEINGSLSNFKLAQQSQTSILRDLQIESAEGKRSAAANAAANWRLEKSKTQDPVTQGLIDQQIRNQEAEIERLNQQLRTLNQLRTQGQ